MSLFRKVIRIRALDSPNVRYALAQKAKGIEPTGDMIVDGVLSWREYQRRRATWDKIRQCIGLDAQFYKGAEVLLYPPEWINFSETLASNRLGASSRHEATRYMGIDPAEGGDKSSWAIINEYGLLKLFSLSTPDTKVIPEQTLRLMLEYGVSAHNVMFDRQGGGKQFSDALKGKGYPVRTVAFGDVVSLEPKRGLRQMSERREVREEKSVYHNRRSQMYGEFSELIDPAQGGFAIPMGIRGIESDPSTELRIQMAPIPKRYENGKLKLPKKHRRNREDQEETLVDLIGHSPDELDAVVIACHCMMHKGTKTLAGVG